MLVAILLAMLFYVFVMWQCTKLAFLGLLEFFVNEKGYTPPTDEQTRTCIKTVLQKKFPWYLRKS